MGQHFLPRKDAELASWSSHFANTLDASPTTYGITADEADAYGQLQRDFRLALTLATQPTTRGPHRVFLKDEARQTLEAETRRLARIARVAADAEALQRLGLPESNGRRQRVEVANETPWVDVNWTMRGVEVRLTPRSGSPVRRPVDSIGALIFTHHGETPPGTRSGYALAATTTRLKLTLPTDLWLGKGDFASRLWIVACWLGPRLDWGPASEPKSLNLPRVVGLRLAA